MVFSLYQFLSLQFMSQGSTDFIFSHLYLTISWNLMCRAGNTGSICFEHVEWSEDALKIYFCHMKNDQTGDRPRDPRHIYANTLIPQICPVLALGISLLCFSFDPKSNQLFPGRNQSDRYRRALSRLLNVVVYRVSPFNVDRAVLLGKIKKIRRYTITCILSVYYLKTRSHSGIPALRHSGIPAFPQSANLTLRHSGTPAIRHILNSNPV